MAAAIWFSAKRTTLPGMQNPDSILTRFNNTIPAMCAGATLETTMPTPLCQHIHLLCTDLDAMISFWEKGFGARLIKKREFRDGQGAVMDINLGAKLYLKSVPCERADAVGRMAGIEHLGMQVPDVEKAVADLTALPGVTFERGPIISETMKCFFVKGPDGILVELLEDTSK